MGLCGRESRKSRLVGRFRCMRTVAAKLQAYLHVPHRAGPPGAQRPCRRQGARQGVHDEREHLGPHRPLNPPGSSEENAVGLAGLRRALIDRRFGHLAVHRCRRLALAPAGGVAAGAYASHHVAARSCKFLGCPVGTEGRGHRHAAVGLHAAHALLVDRHVRARTATTAGRT